MRGEMCVINETGDTKTIWDSDNPAEVAVAERTFKEFKDKGFAAFSVTKKGDKDEQIKKFDPELEKIIFVPPIVGG